MVFKCFVCIRGRNWFLILKTTNKRKRILHAVEWKKKKTTNKSCLFLTWWRNGNKSLCVCWSKAFSVEWIDRDCILTMHLIRYYAKGNERRTWSVFVWMWHVCAHRFNWIASPSEKSTVFFIFIFQSLTTNSVVFFSLFNGIISPMSSQKPIFIRHFGACCLLYFWFILML